MRIATTVGILVLAVVFLVAAITWGVMGIGVLVQAANVLQENIALNLLGTAITALVGLAVCLAGLLIAQRQH